MFELTNHFTKNSYLTSDMDANKKTLYKDGALLIARTICRDAIWHQDQCNWLTLGSENNFNYPTDYTRMMGSSFYDGISGIIYFLTATYSVEKDAIIYKTIQGAITNLLQQEIQDIKNNQFYGKLSFHTGNCGSAFVLDYAGEVLKNEQYIKKAHQLLADTIQLKPEYYGLDIIDGATSAIPVYLYFYNKTSKKEYLDFAVQLGDYLLQKAERKNNTISWSTMPEIENNLTGYAHGTAGMAHCFAELYAATQDTQYKEIVQQVVAYENKHFQKNENNWPDFRNFNSTTDTQEPVCSCAWCHGAPGIGLSRLRCYEILKNPDYLKDAVIAAQTTLSNNKMGDHFNFSLCHGLAGNSELLHEVYQTNHEKNLIENVQSIADAICNDFIKNKKILPSGLQSMKPVYDFMLGDAGVGYFLLRQYDTQSFKNVLLFTSENV